MPIEDVIEALNASSEEGLSDQEVKRRLDTYGPNRLRAIQQRSIWQILFDQFKSLIIIILIAAAVVSFVRQDWIDGGAIVVVLLINTAVGFFTELRATRSIEALQEMDSVDATVRRNGQKKRVAAEELVPGDIVLLEGGEMVSADIRLLKESKLQADEAALTGESVPVDKQIEPIDEESPLAERLNMVYKGTAITRGQGEGIVIATGMETEIGEISALVENAGDDDTPLEARLDQLGRKLVWITLGIAAAVGVIGFMAGRELELMIETAIALAIAAVPEGLPIVATVALAQGMWRMLKHNALMRRLSSVETLGATSIICTDKTGTLTENEMTVRRFMLVSNEVDVALEADDLFKNDSGPITFEQDPVLEKAIQVGVLCNDAELATDDDEAMGDPMEVALIEVAERAGVSREELLNTIPEVERDAFDRETKQMATVHETDQGYFVAVKGAPQNVLDASTHIYNGNGGEPLNNGQREQWLERNRELAADGLRVLALATKNMDSADAEIYENLHFLGLVGFMDPPRGDIQAAIEECRDAGIRVVMVTGDQPATAQSIAHSVSLVDEEDARVITGADFGEPENDSKERQQELIDTSIFARVTPKQKLDLIGLHQSHNSIVAMTGDGVNDAPALKSADIGIAMGQRGTQVAREAADMILQDDAFPTIVAAVEQGRIIFDNIRKFVIYLLSGNVGVILAVAGATVVSAPLPLLPLQILYLNMINDVFPALALGVGAGNKAVMKRKPRDPSEPIITRYHWGEIIGYGVVITLSILLAFYLAFTQLGLDETGATTVAFLTLSISRLLHTFNMRGADSGFFDNEIVKNIYVWGAIFLSLALLVLAVYWAPLAGILELTALGTSGWLLVLGASAITFVVGQLYITLFKSK
ncbi:MAG: cation-transporting P-type ATPase [Anaerolineae bacterium]|nr:cation-transporting P-type ATPase [Anaerolineae bacterium]